MTTQMTFGSLFAGVGGFDLGFEAAGMKCLFQVEWDKHCQQTLQHHWPLVPKWGDVSTVNGAELPPVDVITFGSPCQDLSVAGKRAGLEGGRSGLFFEATRIIGEMQNATAGTFPKYAVWENVVGALSSNNGDDFEAVINEMVNLGSTHIEWSVLNAQFFGVAQRRRRVFVVACFGTSATQRGGQKILAVNESSRRNVASCNQQQQSFTSTPKRNIRTHNENQLEFFLGTFDNSYRDGLRIQKGDFVNTLSAKMGSGGNNVPFVATEAIPIQGTSIGRQDHNGPGGVGAREAGQPMYTLETMSKHCIEYDMVVRRLTPIECERLMGWPDNHTLYRADGKVNADATRYKMCGNGVASPVAEWVGRQIIAGEPA